VRPYLKKERKERTAGINKEKGKERKKMKREKEKERAKVLGQIA
jgi:hypothetical protein